MENAVLERLTNGPEPFSPDGNWVLGHAPEVKIFDIILLMLINVNHYSFIFTFDCNNH